VVLSSEGRAIIIRDFLAGIVISLLVFVFAAASPLSVSFFFFLSPLPIIYFYSKLGRIPGLLLVLTTLAVAFFTLKTLNHGEYVPLICLLSYLGVILAETLRRKISIEKAILSSLVALMIPGLLLITYSIIRTGEAPWQLIEPYIVNAILESAKLYSELGVPTEQVNLIKDNAQQIAVFFINILPALGLVSITLCIWLNLLAARAIFYRRRLYYPDFGDLAKWKTPEKLVWMVIVSGGMLLIPNDRVFYVGLNVLIVCLFVYLLQGLAIISFFFRKKNIPVYLRTIFYALLIFQQIFILLVIAVGLFDLWFDFRKFNKTMSGSTA